MKKIAFSLIFSLSAVILTAQVPLCSESGPVVTNFSSEFSDMMIINDGESGFTAYCGPISSVKKFYHHAIITYDKASNTLSSQELVLPGKTFRIMATDLGDSYFVTYAHYPKWTRYEYVTSIIPKSQSTTNVTPTKRLTFETDRFGNVREYVAKSQNGKYSAVLLINLSKRSQVDDSHFFVYDKNGKEIVSESFSSEIADAYFDVADFKISDKGTVIFLFRTGEKKMNKLQAKRLQILTYENNKFSANQNIDFTDVVVNSARMCLLKDGNIFIGGYTAKSAKKQEIGYFATTYNPTEGAFEAVHSYKFTKDEQPGSQALFGSLVPALFHVICTDIMQLENGNVMMLGEHTAQLEVISQNQNTTTTTYKHFTYHIGYETFKPDGTCLTGDTLQMLYRKAGRDATYSCSSSNEVMSQKYSAIGLSHSAFVKGNDVYVLYTDHEKNLPSHNDSGPLADLFIKRGKSCLIMAKLNALDAPKYQLVYLAGKNKKAMNKLWLFDGKNIYVGSNNAKTYWLDHFQLQDE